MKRVEEVRKDWKKIRMEWWKENKGKRKKWRIRGVKGGMEEKKTGWKNGRDGREDEGNEGENDVREEKGKQDRKIRWRRRQIKDRKEGKRMKIRKEWRMLEEEAAETGSHVFVCRSYILLNKNWHVDVTWGWCETMKVTRPPAVSLPDVSADGVGVERADGGSELHSGPRGDEPTVVPTHRQRRRLQRSRQLPLHPQWPGQRVSGSELLHLCARSAERSEVTQL